MTNVSSSGSRNQFRYGQTPGERRKVRRRGDRANSHRRRGRVPWKYRAALGGGHRWVSGSVYRSLGSEPWKKYRRVFAHGQPTKSDPKRAAARSRSRIASLGGAVPGPPAAEAPKAAQSASPNGGSATVWMKASGREKSGKASERAWRRMPPPFSLRRAPYLRSPLMRSPPPRAGRGFGGGAR
jgi:hypothetical protein